MFAQLYIHDTSNELRNRQAAFASETMQDAILENLQDMVHQYNPYAVAFRNVNALLQETPGVTQLMMHIVTSRTKDPRTYNTPRIPYAKPYQRKSKFAQRRPPARTVHRGHMGVLGTKPASIPSA
jgi:hypothetical protein